MQRHVGLVAGVITYGHSGIDRPCVRGCPVVADIHFHFKRAIEAAENGADCLRINPGNIGDKNKIAQVISTSEIKISVLIDRKNTKKALVALHREFKLDKRK